MGLLADRAGDIRSRSWHSVPEAAIVVILGGVRFIGVWAKRLL